MAGCFEPAILYHFFFLSGKTNVVPVRSSLIAIFASNLVPFLDLSPLIVFVLPFVRRSSISLSFKTCPHCDFHMVNPHPGHLTVRPVSSTSVLHAGHLNSSFFISSFANSSLCSSTLYFSYCIHTLLSFMSFFSMT